MRDPHPWSRLAGAAVQGILLGGALVLSILKLLQLATHSSVFRYEGF